MRWKLVNGTWGGNGIPSDAWTAVQSAPEPGALTLLLSGLLLIGMVVRRRGRA